MYYVVLDLEWNSSYSKKSKSFINEIIEIGAVMVNAGFEVIDTFSTIIKAQLGKRLTSRVKSLTNISNEDIRGGVPFSKAFEDFEKWLGGKDTVIMSWGDSDVRVLSDNFLFFNNDERVPFLKKYLDMQKYFQHCYNLPSSKQVGLITAAELCGIDTSDVSSHRALEDSLLALRCLKKIFDEEKMAAFTQECNEDFYKKLRFKVHNITNLRDPHIDKSLMRCDCQNCNKPMQRLSEWKCVNQAFRALFYCRECSNMGLFTIKFRRHFDRVDTHTTFIKLESAEEESVLTAAQNSSVTG